MFLNQLGDKDKELFLNLCGHAIMADNVVEPEEMEYLALCCYEMEIPNQLPDISEPLEDILDDIVKYSNFYERKIIVFELIRLFKYDGSYDEGEKTFMQPILNKLEISAETHDILEKLADEYITVYNNICNVLSE